MSNERAMRKEVVAALRELDAFSVENGCGIGTPDVNYAEGWIELKHIDAWPKKPETPLDVPHFTPQQRAWHLRRRRAGGKSFVLLKVAQDWFLLDGLWAAHHLGDVTKEELMSKAKTAWRGSPHPESLIHCLKTP